MAMVEVEPSGNWSPMDDATYLDYGRQKDSSGEFDRLPTIVVESNQLGGIHGSDAPIVIYPNDPSVVGAEEVVMEENVVDLDWHLGSDAVEEVVVGSSDRLTDGQGSNFVNDDTSEIPLQDETYATFHPFPCDFCCRRFKKKANLMNHMVAHQTQRPHSCDVCTSRFMRRCDLVNHQKIHSYLPNRENMLDTRQNFPSKKGRPLRGKHRATGTPKRVQPPTPSETYDPPSSSPERSDDRTFRPTSYVDEDVKLLLEMTNKLHESRKSEGSDSNATLSSPPEPQKPTGTADKPYMCSKCNRCFARESALISHSQVHAEDSSHDCDRCGSRFFTIELLREHYSKKHQTTYTGESSSDDDDEANPHKNSYTGDERFGKFTCNICSVGFHRMELLKQHKRNSHVNDSDLYRCKSCHTTFSHHQRLIDHLYSNEDCQEHACMLCGTYFNDQPSVQSHVKSRHGRDLGPSSCVYCGKDCVSGHALKQHVLIHFTERRYKCKRSDCQKKFSTWGKLRRHMQVHLEDRSVQCDACDEEFPDRRALLNHRHSHNRQQKRFLCHECGKSFGSRSSQQIHNRIHTGERPYGCRFCWKAFADGGTLRKHERIHTGEKPYVCAVCPKAFNQRVVLREHIRSHHSGSVNKIGFATPVYHCEVCGIYAASSEELGSHLVKHSDDNTLKNRIPQVGVRPYKRRKKVLSERRDSDEFDESHFFHNSETESVDSDKQASTAKRTTPRRRRENSSYTKFNLTMDAAMKNINSLVETPVRKAKMINTKLQTSPGKPSRGRGAKRKGRKTVEVSYVVTSVPKLRTSTRLSNRRVSESLPEEESKDEYEDDTEDEEPFPMRLERQRTKSENYDSLSKSIESSTFPEESPPVKSEPSSVSKVKQELSEDDAEDDGEHRVCGICQQVFTSKADLLFHVPVHI